MSAKSPKILLLFVFFTYAVQAQITDIKQKDYFATLFNSKEQKTIANADTEYTKADEIMEEAKKHEKDTSNPGYYAVLLYISYTFSSWL